MLDFCISFSVAIVCHVIVQLNWCVLGLDFFLSFIGTVSYLIIIHI